VLISRKVAVDKRRPSWRDLFELPWVRQVSSITIYYLRGISATCNPMITEGYLKNWPESGRCWHPSCPPWNDPWKRKRLARVRDQSA